MLNCKIDPLFKLLLQHFLPLNMIFTQLPNYFFQLSIPLSLILALQFLHPFLLLIFQLLSQCSQHFFLFQLHFPFQFFHFHPTLLLNLCNFLYMLILFHLHSILIILINLISLIPVLTLINALGLRIFTPHLFKFVISFQHLLFKFLVML